MMAWDGEALRARLTAHTVAPDPRDIDWPTAETERSRGWRQEQARKARIAAVLVAFVRNEAGGCDVVLTQRAAHLAHHPSQISFPGGAAEPGDAGLAGTALREAEEEVALPASSVEVIGFLRPHWAISGYAMTPVIGYVSEPVSLKADPGEVGDIFRVPASFLLDASNYRRSLREFKGVEWPTMELIWQDRRIWGVTAQVISNLEKILKTE
ncbi:MAG: CoA pyrophosphatase [Pseudomonadota bacterium]